MHEITKQIATEYREKGEEHLRRNGWENSDIYTETKDEVIDVEPNRIHKTRFYVNASSFFSLDTEICFLNYFSTYPGKLRSQSSLRFVHFPSFSL